ncbi:MAG: DUF3298 domain-containing protein [Patescibacteria group bacterium]|nr:DUF3298 domain-containing protein [Patescibacteria group bacterium]
MKSSRIILIIVIIVGVVLILTRNAWMPKLVNKTNKNNITNTQTANYGPITITTKKINEANFTGVTTTITGSSQIAIDMQKYIDDTINDFRNQANNEVPDMRAQFGANNPTSNYEIDINSKYIKDEKTESLVTSVYTFTGGAHGSTIYKVLTADLNTGKILSLSDVIKPDMQSAFTSLVKKDLIDWRPEGSDAPVVFPDSVNSLTFDDFSNWSMNSKDLIIYFDQYSIGPSVIGTTEFPIPITDLKGFFK